jgi:hypothetical protein
MPTCAGQKNDPASLRTRLMRHLPARRRRSSPTAMGRTPPLGLGKATKPAPASTGATLGGARPWISKLTTAARCATTLSLHPVTQASRRCCMRRPVGPGAVSEGKARKHRATSSGATSGAKGNSPTGFTVGAGAEGCRAFSAVAVAGVKGQSPSESKAAQAFLSNPSRPKLVARSWRSAAVSGFEALVESWRLDSQRPMRSPFCHCLRRSMVKAAAAL